MAILGAGSQRMVFGQGQGRAEEEKGAVGAAEDSPSTTALLLQIMQQNEQREKRMQQQVEQMMETQRRQDERIEQMGVMLAQSKTSMPQQLIDELLEERDVYKAADTLRTPISTTHKRAVPPPAAQRGLHMPYEQGSPVGQQPYNADSPRVGVEGLQFKDIVNMVPKHVIPFYANTTMDKDRTVLMFVLNVESVMGNLLMDNRSQYRLMLVQLCLRDGALAWMERKLYELTEADTKRDFNAKPLNWDDDLRRPFIQAHLGSNTPQLWLAKLKTLVLGDDVTPTPIELDNQFDTIAQHVFPMRIAGDERSELLLATYYGEIVSNSHKWLYTNIVRGNGIPATLRKWKEALANAWNAEAHIRALVPQRLPAKPVIADDRRANNNSRGRGGHAAAGRGTPTDKRHAINALNANDGAGKEGEQDTEDDTGNEQLSAAAGGKREEWSSEQKQMYRDKLCFKCGAPYDKAQGCSKRCNSNKPLKGKADQ